MALEKIGLWDFLEKNGPQTIENIAKELKVRPDLLQMCLYYLWTLTDIVEHNDGAFSLKHKSFSTPFWMKCAYKDVFDNLAPLMRGELEYGKDVSRNLYYLERASELATKATRDLIIQELEKNPPNTLIDLGFESPSLLKEAVGRGGAARVIGINNDKAFTERMVRRVKEADLKSKINIIQEDFMNVRGWQDKIPEKRNAALVMNVVLHDYLHGGEKAVSTFLEDLKNLFPESRLFIAEIDAPSFEAIKNSEEILWKLNIASFFLLHPFANHGLPQSRRTWEKIIQNSRWHIQKVQKAENNFFVFTCK